MDCREGMRAEAWAQLQLRSALDVPRADGFCLSMVHRLHAGGRAILAGGVHPTDPSALPSRSDLRGSLRHPAGLGLVAARGATAAARPLACRFGGKRPSDLGGLSSLEASREPDSTDHTRPPSPLWYRCTEPPEIAVGTFRRPKLEKLRAGPRVGVQGNPSPARAEMIRAPAV